MVKSINITFDNKDYEGLLATKGNSTWRKFMLDKRKTYNEGLIHGAFITAIGIGILNVIIYIMGWA